MALDPHQAELEAQKLPTGPPDDQTLDVPPVAMPPDDPDDA